MNKKISFSLPLIFLVINLFAQENYPHILVNNDDKPAIHRKINEQKWAKSLYEDIINTVKPYVDRHQSDPEWILSRYLMNRIEGKRYTHAYSDSEGTRLIGYSGDAPAPTVRWSTHKRNPNTILGRPYRRPSIEELIPNDTSMYIWCLNTETNKKELIDPQLLVNSINGDINELALNAAVIYWLNGDEEYARFAADILNQWAMGAFYQEPVVGPFRTGFLSIQTLNDLSYESLILAYDFIHPYLKKEGYDLGYYQNVFEKFASTLAFRGYWSSNWYAAVSSTLVYASLCLEDPEKRDYYLQFFLEKDTINGSYGNLGLPSTVKTHFTHDGHWKEPGGYHNFPVSGLIRASWAADKNGFPVFQKFPELFDATHVLLKYAFPNLRHPGFGDAGYSIPNPTTLEFGLAIAAKYNRPELRGMISALNTLIEKESYDRKKSGIYGLLLFLPEIPEESNISYSWPRSGSLEYSRYFLQRNGMEEKTGLMFGVHGAKYGHNQCNGMAMELYGCGTVMGLDMGIGAHYDHYLYKEYYNRWAAHNTVVAGGCSNCITDYPKDYGQIELIAMEPMPDKEAISPNFSFTTTRYWDGSTNTNQLRTMAIIRTSDLAGYYIDIFRSDHASSNDYIYHNLGDTVLFMNENEEILKTESADFPVVGDDSPGFRHFSDVEKLENYRQNLIGLFPVNDGYDNFSYMKFFIPGSDDRTYYKAYSPEANTTTSHYRRKKLPLFTIRKEKEAWTDPFIVVFEPHCAETQKSIKSVYRIPNLCNENNTVVRITHFDGSEQIIFQGNNYNSQIRNDQFGFSGHFGVITLSGGNIKNLYLGDGEYISYKGICLKAKEKSTSAEIQFYDDKTYQISSNGLITFKSTFSAVCQNFTGGDRIAIMGHRGGRRWAPENTLAAYKKCAENNVDWETDLNLTADGQIVLMHDMTLDRTTNAKTIFGSSNIPVNSKTLEQIKLLNAGSHFSSEYAEEKVPTLDEFLDYFVAYAPEKSVISMDTKLDKLSPESNVYQSIIDKIAERDLFDRIFIEVFTIDAVNNTKTLHNGHKLKYAIWVGSDTILLKNALSSGYFSRIHASNKIAPKADDVHAGGVPFFLTHPVESSEDWDLIKNFDINGVSTDKPDVTLHVIKNEIPACSIKIPADGSNFKKGTAIAIEVSVGDTDASIEKVEFYSNGRLIGTDDSRPYSWLWADVTKEGNYLLTAKVYDNTKSKVSSPVQISVK